MEDAVQSARDRPRLLPESTRRRIGKRRLRPDVGVVHLHGDGVLSAQSRVGELHDRQPAVPEAHAQPA